MYIIKVQRQNGKNNTIIGFGPTETHIKLHSDSYSSFQDCFSIKGLGRDHYSTMALHCSLERHIMQDIQKY